MVFRVRFTNRRVDRIKLNISKLKNISAVTKITSWNK